MQLLCRVATELIVNHARHVANGVLGKTISRTAAKNLLLLLP